MGRVFFPTSVHHASYHKCATPLVDPLHFRPLKITSHKHRRRALHPPHMSAHERRRQHTDTTGPLRAPNAAGLANTGDGLLNSSTLPRPPAPPNTQSPRRPYRRRRRPSPPNGRRQPHKRRRQHTSAPPRPTRPPTVSPTPAADQSQLVACLTCHPPQHVEPSPAIPTPAATCPARCPPRVRPAGLADAGGGAETSGRPPRPPAAPSTQSRRRPYRRRRQPAPHDARPEHAPPVLPTPAARHKQVHSFQIGRAHV